MKVFGLLVLFIWCLTGYSLGQEVKCGYYPDGKLRYKGYFNNGKPEGKLIRYYPEGNVKAKMNYRGDTVDVVLYNRKGDCVITGKYFQKKKTGIWTTCRENRLIALEEYQNDLLNGKSIRYTEAGGVAEEKHWKGGKPDGVWKLFFPDGKLKLQTYYVAGELEGSMISYFPEEKLRARGKYRSNLREGVWEFYNIAGELVKKQIYHKGMPEDAGEREIEESRQLDILIKSGKKIPDPAVFADDPEAYMKLTGIE